jgi:hypothetical protein
MINPLILLSIKDTLRTLDWDNIKLDLEKINPLFVC